MVTLFNAPNTGVHTKSFAPAQSISNFFHSIVHRITTLFSPSKPTPQTEIEPLRDDLTDWVDLTEMGPAPLDDNFDDDFVLIGGPAKPKPNGFLAGIKKIFTSTFAQKVYEQVLATPLAGKVNLNLSNGMEVTTKFSLADQAHCNITLTLAPAASKEEKEQVSAFCDQLKILLEKPITETKKAELELLEKLLGGVLDNTITELDLADLYEQFPLLKSLKKEQLQTLKDLIAKLRDPEISEQDKAELKKNPLLKAVLDKLLMDEVKKLLSKFPIDKTSIHWRGSEHKGEINIALFGNARVKVELEVPPELGSLYDHIPPFIEAMVPAEAYEILPGIMPLANENFRFEFDGATNKFALEFESRQVVKLTSLELKGNAIVKWLGSLIGQALKINLPQRIAGTIDPKTMTVKFDPGTTFKVKFNGLERLGNYVDLEEIRYNAAANKLNLRFKLFGMRLNAEIDLNTSMIDRQAFKIVSKHDPKREFAPSILEEPSRTVTVDSSGTNAYFQTIKSALRKMIPKAYQPIFDIFIAAKSDGNLDFNLQDKTVGATFNLPDNITCKAQIQFPDATSNPKGIELDQVMLEKLTKKLQEVADQETFNIEEIISLLLTLPRLTTNLHWEGSRGVAIVTMQLPGGAVFTVELSAPQLIGKSVTEVPPTMEKILSTLLFKEMFTSLRPFLSSDFHLTWDGVSSQFNIQFHEAQQIHIKRVQLPKKGVSQFFASLIGDNSYIKLPTKIEGKINFKDLSVEFNPKITVKLKTGILPSKAVDLRRLQYDLKDPENPHLVVDFTLLGNHSERIPLTPKKPEKKAKPEEEVKVDFEVGPLPPPKEKVAKAISPPVATTGKEGKGFLSKLKKKLRE